MDSAMDSLLANRMWRVRQTVFTMLRDRGYLVTREDFEMTLDDFKEQLGAKSSDELTILAPMKNDPTDQIFVFFPGEDKVPIATMVEIMEKMDREKIERSIVVIPKDITSQAKKAITIALNRNLRIEHFFQTELLVNITKHVLVPRHQVLNNEQKKALLKRYKLKETQLPRIQQHDPVARYYGVEKGKVFKIVRDSETAGTYVTYRLVI